MILLALGIGLLEILKRRSTQLGIPPSAVLAGAAQKGFNWIRGPQPADKPAPPEKD